MKSLRAKADRRTELLSPAGSYDSARAAVNAGADAVYMGGPLFSARAFAESSSEDMLLKTLDFCHMRGVKVYMTLNTLLKDTELEQLDEYLRPYVDRRLDGVIIQDLGVFRRVHELYPELELHVSTQAAVTGVRTARRYLELGAERIVLARELSLDEIRSIREQTGAELEVFAHGALCYCYSGDCLMSSFIGGRSGNRGKCAGTCRLPFEAFDTDGHRMGSKKENYLLSMCDLNALDRLAEMIRAGVYSFKIEGRMKSPVYTAAVTSVYRKYLDEAELAISEGRKKYKVSREDEELLSEVFDRTGTTSGYLDGRNGRDMLTLKGKPDFRSRDEAVIDDIRRKYIDTDIRVPVDVSIDIKEGERPQMVLEAAGISVTRTADIIIDKAQNRPTSEEIVRAKAIAFGETDFEVGNIQISMPEDCFVPVSVLKELRREAADELKKRILKGDC